MTEVSAAVARYVEAASTDEAVRQMHLCGTGAVRQLEQKLEQFYGMQHALCVSNATTGLLALALALDLEGQELVTTPLTHGASLGGCLLLGMSPTFCDVDPGTLTLDPDAVRKRLNRRTGAILAVDILGTPSDTEALRKIADEAGVWYIADAAQSLGARLNGLPASSLADALVVSFTVGKSVFAGEGGAVVTNNTDIYERLLWWTQHPARQSLELGGATNEFGINGRIHPLAAVWANAAFDESLQSLTRHQDRCFELIELLNTLGVVDPIAFRRGGVEPSFFRLCAAWRGVPDPSAVMHAAAKLAPGLRVGPSPVRLIYEHPAFASQCVRRSVTECAVAEAQTEKRFSLLLP